MTEQIDSLRAHAARGGKWTAISAAAGVSLQIAQLVVLGRLLGPSDFGLMAMMMLVIALANSIADFGLGNYLVQLDRLCRSSLNKLLSTVTALSLALTGMVAFSADVVADYYKAPQLTDLLPWLSIAIVVTTLSQIMFALLQRSFAFKAIAVGEIVSAMVALVSAIGVALAGYGVWALVFGQLTAGASRFLMFLPHFLQLRRGLPIGLDFDLHNARRFALFQTGERVLNYVGSNMDKLILGRLVGDTGLGLYTVAYQLMIRPFSVLNPIFTRVALPLFSGIRNDNPRMISGYLQILRVVASLSFPVYVSFSIAAPGIVMLVMGEKWAASAPILSLLSVLGMFFSIGNPIGTLILAKGKPQWGFYINLVSLLVYGLAFAIGAQFGVIGVAWAFLLANMVVLYPLEFFLRYKLVGMGVSQYFKAMMHLFIAAAVPLMVYGLWHYMHGLKFGPYWSFLWGILAVFFFYGYVWLFDRALLLNMKSLIFKGK
jgi:O-antigen/teichoic acid export membrane protein